MPSLDGTDTLRADLLMNLRASVNNIGIESLSTLFSRASSDEVGCDDVLLEQHLDLLKMLAQIEVHKHIRIYYTSNFADHRLVLTSERLLNIQTVYSIFRVLN